MRAGRDGDSEVGRGVAVRAEDHGECGTRAGQPLVAAAPLQAQPVWASIAFADHLGYQIQAFRQRKPVLAFLGVFLRAAGVQRHLLACLFVDHVYVVLRTRNHVLRVSAVLRDVLLSSNLGFGVVNLSIWGWKKSLFTCMGCSLMLWKKG